MELKKMIEQRNALVEEMQGLINSAKTETRAFNETENTRFEEIRSLVDGLDKTIKAIEDFEKMIAKKPTETETRAAKDILNDFIRGENPVETRAQMSTTVNGNIIPTELSSDILKKVEELSGIYSMVRKINSTGKYQQIVEKNKMTAGWTDELAEVTASDPDYEVVEIDHFKLGSLAKIPIELINQANFDITAEVIGQQTRDFATKVETAIIKGTGTLQPTGLTSSGTVFNLASATAITADVIVKIYHSLKAPYIQKAVWLMSRGTLCAIRLLKDSTGVYLFNANPVNGYEGTILGKPVMISEAMDELGSSKTPILFGDFASAYIANVNPSQTIQILNEVYATQGAKGVLGFLFIDGKPVLAEAYATVKNIA